MVSKMKPPEIAVTNEIPDDVRQACLVIVAYMLNTGTDVSMITLSDLKHDHLDLGSFEISARKLPEDKQ